MLDNKGQLGWNVKSDGRKKLRVKFAFPIRPQANQGLADNLGLIKQLRQINAHAARREAAGLGQAPLQ